ncbi:Methyltransferase type 11 [Macleaya cordata]|uniref:Methyltransferase type 11 n=1 Tax=Macleaya cordata TaxID=56857 RepID=A0A200R5T1_MACCD|nr:Methyltransferase type 11 [Macleaya cordata]
MALNVLKLQILRGSIARRVLLRAILFATAMATFPFLQFLRDNEPAVILDVNSDCCAQNVASNSIVFPGQFLEPLSAYAFSLLPSSLSSSPCKESKNLTMNLFRELMDKKLLNSGGKALCVGEGSASAVSALRELGFRNALGVKRHPFPLLMRKNFVHGLDLDDNSFDFVFSRALDRVSVPALFVLEIERILKPGGIGAILVAVPNSNPGSLIKSVTPISSFLKSSDVIHVTSVESFSMVVFKKKIDIVNPFEHYKLPDECSSIKNNKPFIEHLEPLMEKKLLGTIEGRFSYLPKFIDVSSRKRFIYIDIGAGQFMNSNITSRIFDSYPIKARAFNVYVVDHDTSVLSSYVNKPRITFVYHPGLSGNKGTESFDELDDMLPSLNDEGFDFLVWFRETVADGDFVVLKMNAAEVEVKFLHELFDSGAICLVDELFLRCPGSTDSKGDKPGDCMNLFEGLRSSGVFVHQWMEE